MNSPILSVCAAAVPLPADMQSLPATQLWTGVMRILIWCDIAGWSGSSRSPSAARSLSSRADRSLLDLSRPEVIPSILDRYAPDLVLNPASTLMQGMPIRILARTRICTWTTMFGLAAITANAGLHSTPSAARRHFRRPWREYRPLQSSRGAPCRGPWPGHRRRGPSSIFGYVRRNIAANSLTNVTTIRGGRNRRRGRHAVRCSRYGEHPRRDARQQGRRRHGSDANAGHGTDQRRRDAS
jgi:hypothetical protein